MKWPYKVNIWEQFLFHISICYILLSNFSWCKELLHQQNDFVGIVK